VNELRGLRARNAGCVVALLVAASCAIGAPSLSAAQSSAPLPAAAAAGTLGPVPSWKLNQGAPDTCNVQGSLFLEGAETNIPVGQASEQGVLRALGHPNLGTVMDTAFGPHVGPVLMLISAGPYALPPNTPLTLTVTTYNGTNFTGGISYVSTITWNCTTGAVIQRVAPAPALSHLVLSLLGLTLLTLGGLRLSRRSTS